MSDAATSEPRKRKWKAWLLGLSSLLAAATILLLVDTRPAVSITVLGYVTNRVGMLSGVHTLVWPRIAITNNSGRPITYHAFTLTGEPSPTGDPFYTIATNVSGVWKTAYMSAPDGPWLTPATRTLPPGHGVCFTATTSHELRYRIVLPYDNGTTPSRLWQKVPSWIATKVPWSHSSWTVTSEVIKGNRP